MSTREKRDEGFTLIEILIAIVVIGILSAVVVIGITSLTSKGKSTACNASADAAKAAATVHYANTGSYPTDLFQMTNATPAELTLPSGGTTLASGGKVYTVGGWTLTMTSVDAATLPTFACT
ncbi:MAG: type II secretion system protein [Actinomycetota bacterium]